MLLKEDGKDITKQQFEEIISPRLDKNNRYVEEILMPDYIAFYIATAYYDSSEWENSYRVYINSACTIFNCEIKNFNRLKSKVKELLKTRYSLLIIEETPILKVEEL
ncbi:MAG: hypothetical protein K5666_00400 [Bacilli bacterium]|nr:hypothetical protein [Bacilli bacterium]